MLLPFVLGLVLPGLQLPLEITLFQLGTIQMALPFLMTSLYNTPLATIVFLDHLLPIIALTPPMHLTTAAPILISIFLLMTLTLPRPT